MKFKIFGKGPVSGLQQRENTLTYVLILAGPFYVVWGVGMILDMMAVSAELILMELALGIAFWIAGIVSYHANVKSEVAGYKAFNSAKLRFDETTLETVDILFRESDMLRSPFPTSKGREIYRIGPFTNQILYNHPTEGPISFNRANVILPFPSVPWDETFFFGYEGEVWHKGVPSTTSNCEGVVFHVSPNWDCEDGEWLPTMLVADSWAHYMRAKARMLKLPKKIEHSYLDDKGKKQTKVIDLSDVDPIQADELIEGRMIAMQKQITDYKIGKMRAEAQVETYAEEDRNFRKDVKKFVGSIKTRHGNIMRAEEPWKLRVINAKVAALIFALGVTALIMVLFATGAVP